MTTDRLSGVAATAGGVARIRAAESLRPDALFRDPLAEALVAILDARSQPTPSGAGVALYGESGHPLARFLRVQVVIRTVFYDRWLLDAVQAGINQVVVLAAGFDARAFRLPLGAHTSVYELDQPDVLERKDRLAQHAGLSAECRRVTVPCDLRGDWPTLLRGAGHQADAPTAWLVEGLLIYLDDHAAEGLLRRISELSAPGSRLATELGTRDSGTRAVDESPDERVQRLLSLWLGGLEQPVDQWLSQHGWTAARHDLTELAERHGRPLDMVTTAGFVTAERAAPG
jgi:methyltransferase (TIGR00027 family)